MKKSIYYLVILLILSSCQKKDFIQEDSIVKLTISELNSTNAKSFIENEKIKIQSTGAALFIDTIKYKAEWKNSNSTQLNNYYDVLYVPIKYNNNKTGLVFLIEKANDRIEEGYILETKNIIVDDMSKLVAGFYSNKMNPITGTLTAYDFNSKFKWEFGYKEGRRLYKKLSLKNVKRDEVVNSNIKSNSLTKSAACTEYYLITYWDDGSIDRTYIGTVCDNLYPCEVTRYINPSTEMAVKAFCSGGGGSSGGGSSIADIKERITDPCLKSVVDVFLSGAFDNSVTQILKKFGMNDKINLTFIQNDTITSSTKREELLETKTVFAPNSLNDQIVYLNALAMLESTKEYKASRIIHEIIHANLNLKLNFSLNEQVIQHADMLEFYMDNMANSLKNFFPNLTMKECYSLSLEGLGPEVSNSDSFYAYIIKKGFNRDTYSADNFTNLAQQHSVGNEGVGTKCSLGNDYTPPTQIGVEIP